LYERRYKWIQIDNDYLEKSWEVNSFPNQTIVFLLKYSSLIWFHLICHYRKPSSSCSCTHIFFTEYAQCPSWKLNLKQVQVEKITGTVHENTIAVKTMCGFGGLQDLTFPFVKIPTSAGSWAVQPRLVTPHTGTLTQQCPNILPNRLGYFNSLQPHHLTQREDFSTVSNHLA
jgi:hypothetical protein